MSPEFALTGELASYAREGGCQDPAIAFREFRNNAEAKGLRYKLWPSAFKKWIGNHGRYGCPCTNRVESQPKRDFSEYRVGVIR